MKYELLIVLIVVTTTHAVKFTDCGSTVEGLKITVSNCDPADDVCPFYIGDNVTFTTDFTAVKDINSAKIKITGKLGPIPVPFKISPDEACDNYGLVCPVRATQAGFVQISLPIKSEYKPVKVTVQFELLDGKDKLVCTSFPAALKKKQ